MRLPRPTPAMFGLLALAGGACAFASGGELALKGYALGAGSGAFNMMAMWGIISILGRAYTPQGDEAAQPRGGGIFLGLAFLFKLPAYVISGLLAQRLGGAAPGAFLAAIGLVYFCLLWWALTKS